VALAAAGCGSSASGSKQAASTTADTSAPSGTTTRSAQTTKFRACLRKYGATLPAGGFDAGPRPGDGGDHAGTGTIPSTPTQRTGPRLSASARAKLQTAFAACRSLAPAGFGDGFSRGVASPQFARDRACMRKHGVTLPQPGSTQRQATNTKAFRAATQACGRLLAQPSGTGTRP
jgi:hypothetical protein